MSYSLSNSQSHSHVLTVIVVLENKTTSVVVHVSALFGSVLYGIQIQLFSLD